MSRAAQRVDTNSPVPPYEQIRAQLAAPISTGRLAEGELLPTVWQLTPDLGPATGTVARAYREPEAASLIRTRRGAGSRVAPLPAGIHRPHRDELAAPARRLAAEARALGANDTEVEAAIGEALRG
ncbi:GntR family transcriptional regulator [Streptomyces cyaneochromogenes]|uniref:GntR family transcriptional regulator n=1 Tax=Streptomyces cyaneochromogenes TaxID=2496836 RepID=A0A3S9MBW7_9ACTN|nr:GntR family transcriptional regulator [Streptomyces cyaneochromogenes]AZQ36676.1 GntR family transcriptional regulator [Streptomyces cyaneochromogenes]